MACISRRAIKETRTTVRISTETMVGSETNQRLSALPYSFPAGERWTGERLTGVQPPYRPVYSKKGWKHEPSGLYALTETFLCESGKQKSLMTSLWVVSCSSPIHIRLDKWGIKLGTPCNSRHAELRKPGWVVKCLQLQNQSPTDFLFLTFSWLTRMTDNLFKHDPFFELQHKIKIEHNFNS